MESFTLQHDGRAQLRFPAGFPEELKALAEDPSVAFAKYPYHLRLFGRIPVYTIEHAREVLRTLLEKCPLVGQTLYCVNCLTLPSRGLYLEFEPLAELPNASQDFHLQEDDEFARSTVQDGINVLATQDGKARDLDEPWEHAVVGSALFHLCLLPTFLTGPSEFEGVRLLTNEQAIEELLRIQLAKEEDWLCSYQRFWVSKKSKKVVRWEWSAIGDYHAMALPFAEAAHYSIQQGIDALRIHAAGQPEDQISYYLLDVQHESWRSVESELVLRCIESETRSERRSQQASHFFAWAILGLLLLGLYKLVTWIWSLF